MNKYVKFILSALLALPVGACYADNDIVDEDYKCEFTPESFEFLTPKDGDIASTFWKDGKDGYEYVKKLYVIQKNGDVVIITHQFCSLYNFYISYFHAKKGSPESLDEVFAPIDRYRKLAARTDETTESSIKTLKEKIQSISPELRKGFDRGVDETSEENNWMHYFIGYKRLPESLTLHGETSYYMTLNQISN